MKHNSLLNRSVFGTLLLSAFALVFASAPALAQSGPQPVAVIASSSDLLLAAVEHPGVPAQNMAVDAADSAGNQGKTRAQVRAELIEAERAGVIPVRNAEYPAEPETIARNKVRFEKAESWWLAHGGQQVSAN